MRRGHLVALGAAAVLLGATLPVRPGLAAPSPGSLTLGVEGTAPSHAGFSGGPITGSADESGNVAPVVCQAPSCESIPLTLSAPASLPAKSLALTVEIDFTPATGNPGGTGLDGLDVWLVDSSGNSVGQAVTGSSPAVAGASRLDAGAYTIEISGENAAEQETYTGSASLSVVPATPPLSSPETTQLGFGPATVVSPVILGGEPQISFEKPVGTPLPGAIDPNRGFVDWPVSSRTMIGTLWRTTNGGDSYRQLVDLSCAPHQAPNCLTGGGGDTVNRVNGYDGTLNFGDQESLAQEAFASSTDHGDSFPPARQTAVTSVATGVDRQWISTVDAPNVMAGPFVSYPLEAIFSYHIPVAGEIVAGVGTDGIVRPGIPVVPSVSQSGPSRIDTQPGSHGFGWFYQGYRDGTGFRVAAAPLSQFESPTAYTPIGTVTTDQPQVFPWIALDRQGNLYAVWVAPDGNLYYSYSLISDPSNDPTATPPGHPASTWSPKVRVNPASLPSTVFPEVVAGDAGRIAIAYMATTDYSGVSDGAPTDPPARWQTFVSMSLNALSSKAVFRTGTVSHRVDHLGSICTSGTTCVATGGDRSLDDMIDVTMDADGRVACVFMDNNNAFAPQETSLGSQGTPWVKVAKLSQGPSLLTGHAPYHASYPTSYRSAAAGDATWPNNASGRNLPSLDILGHGVSVDGDSLVARIDLADAGATAFTRDLAAYNSVTSTDLPATRLQYVVRFEHGADMYYLAAEADSSGALTFYGGRFDSSNAVSNVNSAVGVAYRAQNGFPVTGELQGTTLLLRGKLSDFGVGPGSMLVSDQAFSLAGPADELLAGQQASSQVLYTMRDVDAAPPLDAILAGTQGQPAGNGTPGVARAAAAASVPNTTAARGAGSAAGLSVAVGLLGALLAAAGRRQRRRGAMEKR